METRAARFMDFLHRRRFQLLGAWTLHAFLVHWFLLGFVSWDGLAYRVPPIVELVEHGHYGMEKFEQWAFIGYVPFVELANAPFLAVFKLSGVLIGFPLLVFPLCVVLVYLFVRALTDDSRAAVFGALAYGAVPFVNEQPYSGYVDFAVCGLLAFFLFSIVRLRAARPGLASATCVAIATALFTMSRAQGLYVGVMLFPLTAYAFFCERRGLRIRITKPRALGVALAGIAVGAIPAFALQLTKYLRHGSPTYPYQFQLLGVKIGSGVSTKELFSYGGLRDETAAEFARSFAGAWVWPNTWPLGGFFDSRNMGGGFVLLVALVLAPFFFRHATRGERWLVFGCILLSALARDFWLPRYAYTLVIAMVIVIARALRELATSPRNSRFFWGPALVLLAHYATPEWDIANVRTNTAVRLNASNSSLFMAGPQVVDLYPDAHARFVIVDHVWEGFILLIYGQTFTNQVVGSVQRQNLGPGCSALVTLAEQDATLLFIDHYDRTKDCNRACAMPSADGARCLAYRLSAARPAQAPPSAGDTPDTAAARPTQ